MPWSNQSGGGGPWGGGSNGGNGGGGGPWGGGGPNRGGGNQPPDIEQLIRKGQEQFRNAVPGGGGPMVFVIVAAVLIGLYVLKATYTIQPDELGVELVLGVPKDEVSEPGLHINWWPIESYEVANIKQNQVNIGRTSRNGTGAADSGLMLSGDQNIVDLAFSVFYQVSNPKEYLFNVADPDEMVRKVAESAMREVVGRRPAQDVFRDDRAGVAVDVKQIIQETLTLYNSGLRVNAVNIEDVAPPEPVADAFDEVQRAEQDEDRFVEEANRYSNKELGQARGEAAQIIEDSEAYKNRVVEEAKGESQRFISVYDEYRKAPEVTRKRMFLETMENVYGKSEKVIIEQGKSGQGVVPYLPLPEINKNSKKEAQQ